jgi:hypothetical protein
MVMDGGRKRQREFTEIELELQELCFGQKAMRRV